MAQESEMTDLGKDISRHLTRLESDFYEAYVSPIYESYDPVDGEDPIRDDKIVWLFHGTRQLYYKICIFLEMKGLPIYLTSFIQRFSNIIDDPNKVRESRNPLFEDSDPSMIILDDFRDFLAGILEFPGNGSLRPNANKLKLILENTNQILARSKIKPSSEPPIYNAIRWYIEIIYPSTRRLNKSRFIKKFGTYKPDILIPEITSAVEYKFIRKDKGIENFLNDLKTDANNYEGDPEYRNFYAILVFQDKAQLNPEGFKNAVAEKKFPENWTIIAL